MNEFALSTNDKTKGHHIGQTLLLWAAFLVALPFLATTVSLTIHFIGTPVGKIWQARMLQSMLFNFGFWLGLCGSAFALTSHSEQRKTLGAAATLFGVANIFLGFALKRVFEQAAMQTATFTPLVVPLVLWFLAIAIAVRAPGRQSSKTKSEQSETTEAQL